MKCSVTINNREFSFEVEGDFFWGKDEVLYHSKDNIIAQTSWEKEGFTVFSLLNISEQLRLKKSMKNIISDLFNQFNINYDTQNFELENYHHYADDDLHQKIIAQTRYLTYQDLGLDVNVIIDRISTAINQNVCANNPLLEKEIVILRISRPQQLDINPPHRDGYLDIWQDTLNLWLPIAGCDENSSLPLIPGSHNWNEQNIFRTQVKSARIKNLRYHVPAIAQTAYGLDMIRPDPKPGEILVFTPFLIHGCAVNLNPDTTRFSLELRFFNQSKLSADNYG